MLYHFLSALKQNRTQSRLVYLFYDKEFNNFPNHSLNFKPNFIFLCYNNPPAYQERVLNVFHLFLFFNLFSNSFLLQCECISENMASFHSGYCWDHTSCNLAVNNKLSAFKS